MVSGGLGNLGLLSSTEMSFDLGTSWSEVTSAALPSPRQGLRAASSQNRIFFFGMEIIYILESVSYLLLIDINIEN